MAGLQQTPTPVNSISFCPAQHPTETFSPRAGLAVTTEVDPSLAILRAAAPQQSKVCDTLLHSSLGATSSDAMRNIVPQGNGFVRTVITAYNEHHALTIRPDDVWLAILTQFSFFVNGNAEALRSTIVAHKGKQDLVIVTGGNRFTMDPPHIALQMTELIQEHVLDPKLREWIMPNFTTTTMTDRSISAVVMMGTMKEYFAYKVYLLCGIPKVTMEGEKRDWEEILRRLEGLKKYGIHTIAWYHLLRPIISRFVKAYDNPDAQENLDFWNQVAHKMLGSGPPSYSGWITAFCVFDEHGKWQGNRIVEPQMHYGGEKAANELDAKTFSHYYTRSDFGREYLTLDGFPYPTIHSSDIPCGYAYVDVKLDDNGEEFDTMFVAGSIGSQIYSTETADLLASPASKRDAVRPLSAWWYFIKGEGKPDDDDDAIDTFVSEHTAM